MFDDINALEKEIADFRQNILVEEKTRMIRADTGKPVAGCFSGIAPAGQDYGEHRQQSQKHSRSGTGMTVHAGASGSGLINSNICQTELLRDQSTGFTPLSDNRPVSDTVERLCTHCPPSNTRLSLCTTSSGAAWPSTSLIREECRPLILSRSSEL